MELGSKIIESLAKIIVSYEANGIDIVDAFKKFGTDIDEDDIQPGGYCGAGGKLSFSKKYCTNLNEEGKLSNFILEYLDPKRFVLSNQFLIDSINRLNELLRFEDLALQLYDSGRRVKFTNLMDTQDGSSVSHYFNSEDIFQEVTNHIQDAKRSILINMYMFTSKPLIDLLVIKSSKNIDIQIILDDNDINRKAFEGKHIDFHIMYVKGWDSGDGINHHKYYIVDDQYLLNGTANATFSGMSKNDENLTVSDDSLSIKQYRENFVSTKRNILKG